MYKMTTHARVGARIAPPLPLPPQPETVGVSFSYFFLPARTFCPREKGIDRMEDTLETPICVHSAMPAEHVKRKN